MIRAVASVDALSTTISWTLQPAGILQLSRLSRVRSNPAALFFVQMIIEIEGLRGMLFQSGCDLGLPGPADAGRRGQC